MDSAPLGKQTFATHLYIALSTTKLTARNLSRSDFFPQKQKDSECFPVSIGVPALLKEVAMNAYKRCFLT